MIIKKYKLLKDLPRLKAGAIFEHREYDKEHPDRGNMGCGCLILGWTYIFPGQLVENREWFEPIEDSKKIHQKILSRWWKDPSDPSAGWAKVTRYKKCQKSFLKNLKARKFHQKEKSPHDPRTNRPEERRDQKDVPL